MADSTVEFGRIPNVPICETGNWPASTGPVTFSTTDFAAAVQAVADCPAVRNPALILGHTDSAGTNPHGLPAVGWAGDLRTSNDGHTLMCDYEGMPAWLAEIAPSAYPDRSIEGSWNFTCSLGHTHDFVITAVALLGTEMPAVGPLTSLQDIASLYGVAAAADQPAGPRRFKTTPKASHMPQPVKAVTSTSDVARVFYETAPWDQWIREIDVDPAQLIVESDDGLLRIPYTISGDQVAFGDPVPVVTEYRDLPAEAAAQTAAKTAAGMAALGPRTVRAAFATRDQSRPKLSSAPAAEPAAAGGTITEKEVGMPDTLIDGLRKQLGLAADADEATVQAAVIEALEERADPPAPPVTEPEQPTAPVAVAASAGPDLHAEITRLSTELAQVHAKEAKREREAFFAAALSSGRIKPNERVSLESMYDEAPVATVAFVQARAAGSAVPLTEVGVADLDEPATSADAVRASTAYKNWSM